jgi:hypothetical protein
MRTVLGTIGAAIGASLLGWLTITAAIVVLYYCGLMAALVAEFGDWPNYAVLHDWPGNVARIFASTPSFADAVAIAREEWILEIGYLNMAFGLGISEWSLTLIPDRMLIIVALGMILATFWALGRLPGRACRAGNWAAAGIGSGLIGLTGATLSWVVCCAYPSWIVGLTMLGLSVATANWLEPLGLWLNLAGFLLLSAALIVAARRAGAPTLSAHAGSLNRASFAGVPARAPFPTGGPRC